MGQTREVSGVSCVVCVCVQLMGGVFPTAGVNVNLAGGYFLRVFLFCGCGEFLRFFLGGGFLLLLYFIISGSLLYSIISGSLILCTTC